MHVYMHIYFRWRIAVEGSLAIYSMMYTSMYIIIHVIIYMYICVCVYIYIHVYIHVYMHIYFRWRIVVEGSLELRIVRICT